MQHFECLAEGIDRALCSVELHLVQVQKVHT